MEPTTTATPDTRTPVEIVTDLFASLINQRDADLLAPYWDENVHEVFPTGDVHGRQSMRDYFAATFAAMPDFHIEAEHIAGEGETVFVKWRMTGTFSGAPWQGIEPTGNRIELHGMDCFTFRDGAAVHNHVIYDQLSFARQIGMLPPKDSGPDKAMTAAFNAKTKLKKRLRG
ncbi:MAG: hypothetical protein QOD66_135 [Solirubrobacteraceae bacterium]|jgi:predicted ester cyclase|nr:hypothetical protein [Solirubrobacteraceae bacterium]MEA2396941.1 hypothetical protein [Thermoleophilaceae bacterium]